MIHQLSGGAWGVVIRRPIGAASRVLPVLTLLFLPIAFGMRHLYDWTHADVVAHDEMLQHKQLYLNMPFFLVRAAIYFARLERAVVLPERVVARAGSHRRSAHRAPHAAAERRRAARLRLDDHLRVVRLADVARAALVLDDLRRAVMGGQGLAALAFLIIVLAWLSRRPPLDAHRRARRISTTSAT